MIDGADFEERTASHGGRLRRLLRRLSGHRVRLLESASDLVQSVFRTMWRKRDKVPSDPDGFWAWARLEAKRKAADRGRYYGSSARRATLGVDAGDLAPDPLSPDAGPAERAAESERADAAKTALSAAMASLSPQDRHVIVECRLKGRPLADFAAESGERVNTVSVRLHRALARLALALPSVDALRESA